MSTPAQILANRQNAERSLGPVTAEGRARVSPNATRAHREPLGLPLCAAPKELGLFSVANFVRPEEQGIFNDFESGYMAELSPDTPLEQTLAREIIHAAWRLRRCANLEVAPPENLTDEELDRLQISIDRARAAAQRTLHRSLKELRRLQGERVYATHMKRTAETVQSAQAARGPSCAIQEKNFAKQTQSQPEKTAAIPRSAPCPCKSGQKYKRCCGRDAPPVLTRAA
jgi:SEC-C motif